LDEGAADVVCKFSKVKKDELLAVVYTKDMSIFDRTNKWMIDAADADEYEFDEYEKKSAN